MSPQGTVIHISTTDGEGGASRAARRLHEGLDAAGWEPWLVAGLARMDGKRTTTLVAESRPPLASVEAFAPYFWSRFGELRMLCRPRDAS